MHVGDEQEEAQQSPEQRKAERRRRIQGRIQEEKEAANPALRPARERDLTESEQRIADGLSALDAAKSGTIEHTTAVRLEVDVRENRRQTDEEADRRSRLKRLQEEALESGRRNAAIEMRWAEVGGSATPQDLRDAIAAQMAACAAVRASKDAIVASFRERLKHKDEEFVSAVQAQERDVDELLRRMDGQYRRLAAAYAQEIAAIEDAFDSERAALLRANRAEADALFEKRRQQELSLARRRQEMRAEFLDAMETMREEDAEEFTQLKVKLQGEIQTLEQQLQDMRATYLLNQEKLEYNFRVLTERDAENTTTVARQKKKLQRLKESIAKLKARDREAGARFKQTNEQLAAEYRRVTDQYHELLGKSRHFRDADQQRVAEVQSMHEDEIATLREKVTVADRVLHTAVLGWEWRPPPPPVQRHPMGVANATRGTPSASGGSRPGTQATGHTSGGEGAGRPESVAAALAGSRDPLLRPKVETVVSLLSDCAGFLVDAETRAEIEQLDKDEAAVARADAVFAALGVETGEDVYQLLGYFFSDTGEDVEEGEDVAALVHLNLKVAPEDVVAVAREFVDDRDRQRAEDLGAAARTRSRAADAHARRVRVERAEKRYWEELASPLPPATERVWPALARAMERYAGLLKDRANALHEVGALRAANAEMRGLLNQYLGGPVNEALYYPPTQVIRVHRD